MTGTAWRVEAGGLLVRVRASPRSARDGVEGLESTVDGPALKVRIRAVPADGEANAAVVAVVAGWLGVPRSAVALATGGRSRVKTVRVAGDGEALARRAADRLSGG